MLLPKEFQSFLSRLSVAEYTPRPDNEGWNAMIARISNPGTLADIDEETYDYFLNVLPPKQRLGAAYAFAEGAEPLRLFWRSGRRYLCRQLTWDETRDFCRLTQMSFPYWS